MEYVETLLPKTPDEFMLTEYNRLYFGNKESLEMRIRDITGTSKDVEKANTSKAHKKQGCTIL